MILGKLTTHARYIGLDRDAEAIARSRARLEPFGARVTIIHADYRDLARILHDLGIAEIHGALLDLGLSSLQLDDPGRGFAYRLAGPLDLRFDTSTGPTAAEWLADADEALIAEVLHTYGEERHARKIARLITAQKSRGLPILTTGDLVALIRQAVGAHGPELGRSAARVFQALRIAVNDELAAIPHALADAVDHLADGGRLVVIAYHSLEDRIVKDFMREAARECSCPKMYPQCVCGADPKGILPSRRALRPSADEIKTNPRAKAAKLRLFERRRRLGGRR